MKTEQKTLASLSKDECKEVFKAAFGYQPKETLFQAARGFETEEDLMLTDGNIMLQVLPDGNVELIRPADLEEGPLRINVFRTAQTLMRLGITFPEPSDALMSIEQARHHGRNSDWMRPSKAQLNGPLFHIKLLESNLPKVGTSEGLDHLLNVVWHWVQGETLHTLTDLEEFKIKMHQEIYYMQADQVDVGNIQVQWLDEKTSIAIASNAVPITIYAIIGLTEKPV